MRTGGPGHRRRRRAPVVEVVEVVEVGTSALTAVSGAPGRSWLVVAALAVLLAPVFCAQSARESCECAAAKWAP